MTIRVRLVSFCLVVGVFISTSAFAHEVRPGRFELIHEGEGAYRASLTQPQKNGRWLALRVKLPDHCVSLGEVVRAVTAVAVVERWRVKCDALSDGMIAFPGIERTLTDIYVRIETNDGKRYVGLVRRDAPVFTLKRPPGVSAYFMIGVDHIASGVDHLMFVGLLVLLLGVSVKLVKVITAFTIAHSFTLGAVVIYGASPPSRAVEAVIALSVAFLAYEVIGAARGKRTWSIRHPWGPVFAFGLLHGFGFGGALTEIGLPIDERAWALLFFNLGVEVGQVLFVCALAPVLLLVRCLGDRPYLLGRLGGAYVIGGVALYWTFARLTPLSG